MSANVGIGRIKLASGGFVKVSVDPRTGEVYPQLLSHDERQVTWAGLLPAECSRVAALLKHAAKVAPSIKAAHDTMKRSHATAEATYQRIITNAVGAR